MTTPSEPHTPQPVHPVGRLGDYYLLRKIGQGGMGEIYLAKRVGVAGFEKTFVIKVMLTGLADDPEFVGMFLDEARLAARLTHPNIAQIYDFGAIEGQYYIAMEHIPGEDLAAIMTRLRQQNARLPLPVALRIMLDLCAGLEYAHTLTEEGQPLGIIHRDISPANIMVSYQGAVKLLDFGIAKAASQLAATQAGNLKGKTAFLSPEHIQGLPLDARADVFSLGITLYVMLTQKHPFRGDNDAATMHAILNTDPPDPREVRSGLPDALAAIVAKALRRDRNDRYASVAQMGEALQRVLAVLAPATDAGALARFLVTLFGVERMQRRTTAPSLRNVVEDEMLTTRSLTPMFDATVVPGPAPQGKLEEPTSLQVPPRSPAPEHRPRTSRMLAFAAGMAVTTISVAAIVARVGIAPADGPPQVAAASAPMQAPPPAGPVFVPRPAPAPAPAIAPPAPPASPRRIAAQAARPRLRQSGAPPRPVTTLDGGSLQAVVTRAHPRFTACFERHSAGLPGSTGEVAVELTVVSSGKVSVARAGPAANMTPELARCLEGEARRLMFPRHNDREVRFAFPLKYRKGTP